MTDQSGGGAGAPDPWPGCMKTARCRLVMSFEGKRIFGNFLPFVGS